LHGFHIVQVLTKKLALSQARTLYSPLTKRLNDDTASQIESPAHMFLSDDRFLEKYNFRRRHSETQRINDIKAVHGVTEQIENYYEEKWKSRLNSENNLIYNYSLLVIDPIGCSIASVP